MVRSMAKPMVIQKEKPTETQMVTPTEISKEKLMAKPKLMDSTREI